MTKSNLKSEKYNNHSNGRTNPEKNEARNHKFKVGDVVSIKMDRVDMASPQLHFFWEKLKKFQTPMHVL